jgi:hypothetical protein
MCLGIDGVLDGDGDADEDVVAGLGLHAEVGLLHAERERGFRFYEGQLEAETRGGGAVELAEALDDGGVAGLHGEEGREKHDKKKKGKDSSDDRDSHEALPPEEPDQMLRPARCRGAKNRREIGGMQEGGKLL